MPPKYLFKNGKSSHGGGFGGCLSIDPISNCLDEVQLARIKLRMNINNVVNTAKQRYLIVFLLGGL